MSCRTTPRTVLAGTALLVLAAACSVPGPEEAAPASTAPPVSASKEEAPPARVRGNKGATRPLELVIEGAQAEGNAVVVQVRLANVSEDSYALIGNLGARDVELHGADGSRRVALSWSHTLERFEPIDGFAPGKAREGWIRLARPTEGPYTLHVPGFEAAGVVPRDTSEPAPDTGPPNTASLATPPPVEATSFPDMEPEDLVLQWGKASYRLEPTPLFVASQIEDLLGRQVEAIRRQDVASYLETFLPNREARDHEQRSFTRGRQVPLADVSYAVLPRSSGSAGRYVTQVFLIFQMRGLPDDNPFVYSLLYRFRIWEDRLYVEKISDNPTDPIPWRKRDMVFQKSHHFLIYGPEERRAAFYDVSAELESAYASLQGKRLPMQSGYAVHLAGKDYQLVGGGPSILGFARVLRAEIDGAEWIHSRAFWLNGLLVHERIRHIDEVEDIRRTTLKHELVHLTLSGRESFTAPSWLKEGAAVYYSDDLPYNNLASIARKSSRGSRQYLRLESLSRSTADGHAGATLKPIQYPFAGSVVKFLVDRGGHERFLRFYQSFAEAGVEDETLDVTSERLQRFYGWSLLELENEVLQHIRQFYR